MADIDAETLRKAAVAIWAVQREDLDKCDMELDDVGDHYDTFKMASAAVACLLAPEAVEDADAIERLQNERNRFRGALLQIKYAAEDGRICDDVAWFSQYETLFDYIEGTLETAHAALGDLFQGALRDCPFCGGKAIRRDDPGVPDVPFGLVVDHQPGCFLGFRDLQPDAVIDAAWNTRAFITGTVPAQEAVAWRYVYNGNHDYPQFSRKHMPESYGPEWTITPLYAAPQAPTASEDYPGLPMSDADLIRHYEASKRDMVGLVGSEVRQIIGELRHLRAALSPRRGEG